MLMTDDCKVRVAVKCLTIPCIGLVSIAIQVKRAGKISLTRDLPKTIAEALRIADEF